MNDRHQRRSRTGVPGVPSSAVPVPRERLRDGFTLIELLVVLTIIGIIAGIAAPRLDPVEFRMNGAVNELGTTLLAAQREAVMRQHNVVVAFDSAGGRIRIHSDKNNNGVIDNGEAVRSVGLPEDIFFGLGGAPARPRGSDPISLEREQDGMPAITFHRNGSASEEGVLYLMSHRAKVLGSYYATDTHAVEIERSTGRASWYRYDGSQWQRRY